MSPIICLSKNRADVKLAKTLVQASEQNEDFRKRFCVLIEPQDLEKYKSVFPKLNYQLLSKNDGGLAFARKFAINMFRNKSSFWMLDDDISFFGFSENKKVHKKPMSEIFPKAEETIKEVQKLLGSVIIGQAALEYQQFSWSATNPLAFRSYCDVAVWINAPLIKKNIDYREVTPKEDRDFTLQILNAGHETLRLRQIAFSCPKNGSNKGGLFDVYSQPKREMEAVEAMIKLWPKLITKQTKKDGRIDCKINWKASFRPAK